MNGPTQVTVAGDHAPFTDYVERSFDGSVAPASKPLPSAGETRDFFKAHQADRKKMKAFIRNSHWPPQHQVRKELWWSICNVVRPMKGSVYHDMISDAFGPEGSYEQNLPTFVDPSNMHNYHLSTAGILTAKKIVCAIGKERPDILFAPTIYALTSLLLHYVEEEHCFNTMELLLDGRLAYVVQTKVAYEVSRYVLRELVRKYAKSCYQYITKAGRMPIERVLDNWLWWILHDLPFEYLVRVIDCYLYEGPKVLYRVALAILILFHKVKVKGSERLDMELSSAISQFCEDMATLAVPVDRLLKTAFGIRGLSRKEISKLLVKNEMYVKSLSQTAHKNSSSLPKSPSCETLTPRVKVARTFSLQEIGAGFLSAEQSAPLGYRSRSQGMVPAAQQQRSELLTQTHWDAIWQWIPPRVTVMIPELIFSTSEHGVSLQTFFNKVEGYEPTLLLVKAVTGEVFGAYCSTDWYERHEHERNLTYIGTGETFVFSLTPDPIKYEWIGIKKGSETPNSAQLFMSGDNSQINIGGGTGTAIHLDATLDMCYTESCDTFENPPFVQGKEFRVGVVEVFSFQ